MTVAAGIFTKADNVTYDIPLYAVKAILVNMNRSKISGRRNLARKFLEPRLICLLWKQTEWYILILLYKYSILHLLHIDGLPIFVPLLQSASPIPSLPHQPPSHSTLLH